MDRAAQERQDCAAGNQNACFLFAVDTESIRRERELEAGLNAAQVNALSRQNDAMMQQLRSHMQTTTCTPLGRGFSCQNQ